MIARMCNRSKVNVIEFCGSSSRDGGTMRVTPSSLLLVIGAAAVSCVGNVQRRSAQQEDEAKEALEALLEPAKGYNKFYHPTPQTESHDASDSLDPVLVNLSVHINRVEEIAGETNDFIIYMTLRQNWNDERLKLNMSEGSIAVIERSRVWGPALSYAPNKVKASSYKNLVDTSPPDEPVSVSSDGEIQYDVDLPLRFSCPDDSTTPQTDYKVCSLTIASIAHKAEHVSIGWDSDYAVTASADVVGPKIAVPGFRTERCDTVLNSAGMYSCVSVDFMVEVMGGLLRTVLEAYLPLGALVLLTTLSLWFPARSRSTRLCVASLLFLLTVLCAILVLTLTPAVHDTTALMCWAAACIALADLPIIAIAVPLCRDKCAKKPTQEDSISDIQEGSGSRCCVWSELSFLERATALLLPAALFLLCLAFYLVLRGEPVLPPDVQPLTLLQP